MKVLIAIDSFKGSLSSAKGSEAIALGIREVYKDADIITLPLADGGEGTVESLVQATKGRLFQRKVTGPLGEKAIAKYGILGDGITAVIEVAEACGLPLVPDEQRNPAITTTYGVGELIADAIEKGCEKFVIGLGGSATNDAGVGMLQALGFRFLDQYNEEVGFGGRALRKICKIDTTLVKDELKECTFKIACDVNNFLHGTEGAAYIFGPQKGATPALVKELDDGLKHFADVVQQEIGKDTHHIEGGGAAGGLGSAFSVFLNAKLHSGIELVLESIEMEAHMKGADFIITGEGKLDDQTAMGKAPLGVARLACKHSIPVIAVAGGITGEAVHLNELGITSHFSIMNAPMSLEEAMDSERTFHNLRQTTNQLFRLIKTVQKNCQDYE